MTIIEALKIVMSDVSTGLTSKEAYQEIINRSLYSFPAKNPAAVVNSIIRRHCLGLDFPTANSIKHFKIVSYRGKKPCYGLIDSEENVSSESIQDDTPNSELLPEEKMQNAYNKHIANIQAELTRQILNNHPSFFEHLVVDLLLAMGYGYDKSSGIVVGGPHDGGIDGIVYEDKLGLDRIYLQAKRYKPGNTVGRQDLQAFVGAMQNIQKGVFITTSSFTKEAYEYAKTQQQKNLMLIDGQTLGELMIKYEVGIVVEHCMKIYRLDTAYFE